MSPREGYYLPQRQLVSQADASMVERPDVPRSRFSGAWTVKTGFDAGYLIPFLVEEILPGDHMQYDVTAYVRLSTPLFPMFDNQRIDTFFFFVPNRLIWTNWERFMGHQDQPSSSIDYTIPVITSPAGGFAEFSLYDYMGIPVTGQITAGQTISVNALPFRAYNLIYNEWFRDQNIQNSIAKNEGNGPDTYTDYARRFRNKSHDYFTSCLPWPQKFTAPTVALGGIAPVLGVGFTNLNAGAGVNVNVFDAALTNPQYAAAKSTTSASADDQVYFEQDASGYPTIYADLSEATGVAINTFRLAYMTQMLLERDARGGTRYTETILMHFGVRNPDFRLQRPEYIGGGQSPLIITPIAQTGVDSADTGLGALGGAGTAAGQHRASYAATEHGYIIGIINVRTELSYQQGLHKMWTRSTRYDFYFPSFAGLGEQAVLQQEIYCTGTDASDTTVFGYQERWQEYRTRTSMVTGIMRSYATGTLDAWHLAQEFSAAPTLNSTFLQDTPDMARVLAAGALAANQQYLADIMIRRTAVRPIPLYGTPAPLGRF